MKPIRKLFMGILIIGLVTPLACLGANPFADLPDPTRHKKPAKAAVKPVERKKLVLQSTLVAENRRYAVINGKQVGVGELVSGARVISINPFNVVIERQGRQKTLKLITADVVRDTDSGLKED